MAGAEIIGFLDRKKAQGFTGCVKLVFEDSKLSVVQEANHLEFPMTKLFSQSTVAELVAKTEEKGFSGSLVFSFNRGAIDFYSYMRNYRGSELEALVGNAPKGGRKK